MFGNQLSILPVDKVESVSNKSFIRLYRIVRGFTGFSLGSTRVVTRLDRFHRWVSFFLVTNSRYIGDSRLAIEDEHRSAVDVDARAGTSYLELPDDLRLGPAVDQASQVEVCAFHHGSLALGRILADRRRHW